MTLRVYVHVCTAFHYIRVRGSYAVCQRIFSQLGHDLP